MAASGWHSSEEGVRQCLVRAFHTSGLAWSDIQFEQPVGAKRLDLWIGGHELAVELKFHRPLPSGHTRPLTQQFGELLIDCRKLASAPATRRLFVLVTDRPGATHLTNKRLFPTSPTSPPRTIEETHIEAMPPSATRALLVLGDWIPLRVALVYRYSNSRVSIYGWDVEPTLSEG